MTLSDGHLVWNEVSDELKIIDSKIFDGVDKSTLSDYEKRKMIFEYLCNNLKYDFDMLTDMLLLSFNVTEEIDLDELSKMDLMTQYSLLDSELSKKEITHDSDMIFQIMRRIKVGEYKKGNSGIESVKKVFEQGVGLCNSDSQVYKMLLELNGIYSVVVFCDNNELRLHSINLVYDIDSDSYSFDDISTYTAAKSYLDVTPDMSFDYDLEYAYNVLHQGGLPKKETQKNLFEKDGKYMEDKKCFYIYSSDVINFYFGKPYDEWYKQFDLEKNDNIMLPDNIVSLKNNSKSL